MTDQNVDTGQCVRCGYCCTKVTCLMGMAFGADTESCKFLKGDGPGGYSCQVIEERPDLAEEVAIGGGCSSSLYNDVRDKALKRLGIKRRPFPFPWISA